MDNSLKRATALMAVVLMLTGCSSQDNKSNNHSTDDARLEPVEQAYDDCDKLLGSDHGSFKLPEKISKVDFNKVYSLSCNTLKNDDMTNAKKLFKTFYGDDFDESALSTDKGEKKLKNLPKIGVNDDPVLAEKATADFKEMKKQMKTVIGAQKQRLEYVLMLDRKWSAEAWKALFVKNPLMHCFAIGLIWGIYENGCLKTSFRYLDDGSFTNSDDDEIELSEVMQIGLVHPLELTEHEKEAWLEQLDDYEIIQPFDQLKRKVYKVAEIDKNKTACEIFKNTEITNTTLVNRMTKAGWYKGQAQDAGFFYEFIRNDISGKEKDPDGKLVNIGMTAELKFSGTYIGYYEIEDVTVEELYFRLPDAAYNDNMKLGDVNPRYYSEVVLQLKKAINK